VCTNGLDPYHMTLWEGVPLREILYLTGLQSNIRRVYYQSYHPEGVPPFQSSLSLSQILETPPGQNPVILAYKMNGQAIPASVGGPVRVVVPGSYGSKSIKWVQRVVLTNDSKANDTDADLNNDPESPLKTRARFIYAPTEAAPGQPVALTGMAQIGISGLGKVQVCVYSQAQPWPADDPHRAKADWKDAAILPAPEVLPPGPWPRQFTIAHWAVLLPGLPAGSYELCCHTIDGNGIAQPMPRPPLPRTGVNAVQRITLVVRG
jgi:DMSO/TMAO reductase YedYZ molybdopterin-dependent catalytic subunit